MPKLKKWSLKYEACIDCGTTTIKHRSRGLCRTCYNRDIENKQKSHPRKYGFAGKKLTQEYLSKEYIVKEKSLNDIAKECSCTRQYVYKKIKEYKIPGRDRRSARNLALKRKKIKFERIDDGGQRGIITLQKNEVNENFFDNWSAKMAYVLGVIITDGNIRPGSIREPQRPDTLKIGRLTISQKEPELLNKVLRLMDCNAKLLLSKRKVYGNIVSGKTYYFHINSDKIYDDLTKFGLSPDKSLSIDFPEMPQEYARHFIRGCWDGDGSVYLEARSGAIRASFISGSLLLTKKL